MSEGGEYQFVSWVRTGIGALLGGAPATARIPVAGAGDITHELRPRGPGDVMSIDPRAFVRTVPRADVSNFEVNLFPSVELAHPALPWMLSPPADALGRVTPWMVLVVVEQRAGVTLAQQPNGVRVLTIDAPASPREELPDLGQAWAWAHAQTTGAAASAIELATLATSNGAGRSRLIAARKLEPDRRYIGCVVPTFAASVVAGLGLSGGGDGFAWTGSETIVRLPVYRSWSFGTGHGGDFASLVQLLRSEKLDAGVGHRRVDISAPGWGAPTANGVAIEVTGALRSVEWTPPPSPAAAVTLGAAIVAEIDAAATTPTTSVAPVYPPPNYGSAGSRRDTSTTEPAWQTGLNRDVAQRVAAALGATTVRANLDALVAAAWSLAGDAAQANALIRRCELAAEITQRLANKHVEPIADDGEVLAIARPLLARMQLPAGMAPSAAVATPTVAAAVRASAMPNAALSASLRTMGRSGGPIARSVPAAARTGAVLAQIDGGKLVAVPPAQLAAGAVDLDTISREVNEPMRIASATPDAVASSAARWVAAVGRTRAHPVAALARVVGIPEGEAGKMPPPLSSVVQPDPVQVDEFAAAARVHQAYIVNKLDAITDHGPVSLGGLASLRASIAAQWTPSRGIAPLLASRLGGLSAEAVAGLDTFQPITITGVLDRPMLDALNALAPAHAMPGLGAVVPNRVAAVAASPEFVRAFLVGANEELDRQLAWRGVPTARGQTWLQTFWGRVVVSASGAPTRVPDIPPIASWPAQGPDPTQATLVLLVRGDVLQRYPNALVYAVEARWDGVHRVVGDGDPKRPTFVASLGGDIALFGFDLEADQARGSDTPGAAAGWYFVIAEHPHEPRFGLAVSATLGDVAWTDVTANDLAASYLRVDGPLVTAHGGVDGARLAAITLRRTIRVARHASTMV